MSFTIEASRRQPQTEWREILANISQESLMLVSPTASPHYHAEIALREVPEQYLSNIPSLIFYINHCARRDEPLHGDMRVQALNKAVLDDPDIQQLLNNFGASSLSYKRNVESDPTFLETQMPPFPLLLVPDMNILRKMCDHLSIEWKDFNVNIDPRNRERLYALLHAIYGGGVPETDSRMGYASVGQRTTEYFPFTRFNNKLERAKRLLRPTLEERLQRVDPVAKYYLDHDVTSWLNGLAPATVHFTGRVEHVEYTAGDPTSYYDFLQHAQEVFPDHHFGSLDRQASGINQMHLAGGRFTTNNGVLGAIFFSSSSDICRKHVVEIGLYDNM